MKKSITRFDSKGRLLIPSYIRRVLKTREGTDVIIIPDDEKSCLKIVPLLRDRTAEIRLTLEDIPGSLARIATYLSQNNLDIIMSESRTLARGKLAEWDVIVDTSKCGDLEVVRKGFLELANVKDAEILKKG